VCEVDLFSSPEPLFQRLRLVRGFVGSCGVVRAK
jgi:hypothetical protein